MHPMLQGLYELERKATTKLSKDMLIGKGTRTIKTSSGAITGNFYYSDCNFLQFDQVLVPDVARTS
jgi:hypothetical protein